MRCTIFSQANPTKLCGLDATRYVPLAIGALARMQEMDDALLLGYAPLCPHHSEMLPPGVRLFKAEEIAGIPMTLDSING